MKQMFCAQGALCTLCIFNYTCGIIVISMNSYQISGTSVIDISVLLLLVHTYMNGMLHVEHVFCH